MNESVQGSLWIRVQPLECIKGIVNRDRLMKTSVQLTNKKTRMKESLIFREILSLLFLHLVELVTRQIPYVTSTHTKDPQTKRYIRSSSLSILSSTSSHPFLPSPSLFISSLPLSWWIPSVSLWNRRGREEQCVLLPYNPLFPCIYPFSSPPKSRMRRHT